MKDILIILRKKEKEKTINAILKQLKTIKYKIKLSKFINNYNIKYSI